MEKKAYMEPRLKALRTEEHLMLNLSNGEGNGEQFSKEVVMDDENDFQSGSKSVWDD